MVFLYNIAPYILILAIAITGYFAKGWKRKVGVALIAIGLAVLYPQLQPSYMPKGTVPQNTVQEFEVVDKPLVDRMAKPMSADERDSRMAEMKKHSDEQREALVEKIKSEKE